MTNLVHVEVRVVAGEENPGQVLEIRHAHYGCLLDGEKARTLQASGRAAQRARARICATIDFGAVTHATAGSSCATRDTPRGAQALQLLRCCCPLWACWYPASEDEGNSDSAALACFYRTRAFLATRLCARGQQQQCACVPCRAFLRKCSHAARPSSCAHARCRAPACRAPSRRAPACLHPPRGKD